MSAETIVTLVTSQTRTGKTYSLRAGELHKTSVVTAKGSAVGVPVASAQDIARLLAEATSEPNKVIVPGHFTGDDGSMPFDIVYEPELAELLGKAVGDEALAGVHVINGRRVAARLKRSIEPCAWQLLDFDTPEGMPTEFAQLDIAGRLALLEKVVPGIGKCERVECRSSSARVVPPGGKPGRASHAWIRVNEPTLVETMRVYVQVEAELAGIAFLSPRHSAATGEVVGHSRLTLVDLSVLVRGRIVFCSAPTVTRAMLRDGWSVDDAGVRIVNPGGALDISRLAAPKPTRLKAYHAKTGERLEVSGRGTSFAVVSRGLIALDTPIETSHAPGVATFGDAVTWLQNQPGDQKLRCQAPFRASTSEAAFIRIDLRGQPFLHDAGTGTTYRLGETEAETTLRRQMTRPLWAASFRPNFRPTFR